MFSHGEKSISIFISPPGKEMTYYTDYEVPTSILDGIIRLLQFFNTAVCNICNIFGIGQFQFFSTAVHNFCKIIFSIELLQLHSTTVYTLIIRLILDYRNCVIIMHFRAPNPYNDTGVRYYNLLWYNCKHIYVIYLKEEFGDTNVVIRFRKSKKNRQCNDPKKRNKRQTAIYKTLYRKLNDHGTRTSLKF